jgi:uncharacterized protein (DUF2236 family)
MSVSSTSPSGFEHHRAAVRARLLRSDHVRTGPDSVSWKINREALVIAGWGRAILMQLAHPSIAAGIDAHSSFRGSLRASVRRLYSTVAAMLSLTFGDTDEVINAAAGIHVIHDRVRGVQPAYSAHDPELQRWVHATLLDSIPLTFERLVGPLTPRERDRYCLEAAIMEPLLGMPSGLLPRSTASLDDYLRQMYTGGALVVTDRSRSLARAVLYPPQWRLVWPAFRVIQLMTIGSLPPPLREAYGFEWRPRDDRSLSRWVMVIRIMRRALPGFMCQWPMARVRRAIGDVAIRTTTPATEGGSR